MEGRQAMSDRAIVIWVILETMRSHLIRLRNGMLEPHVENMKELLCEEWIIGQKQVIRR